MQPQLLQQPLLRNKKKVPPQVWNFRGDYDYYLVPAEHRSIYALVLLSLALTTVDSRNKVNGGVGRKSGQARKGWCFTLKALCDPKDSVSIENEALWIIGQLIDHCALYAFQLESAPDTGYAHYQGYFELEKKNRFEWIQKHLIQFEFLQERKGTPVQAVAYCTKTSSRIEGPWTMGTPEAAEGAQLVTQRFVRLCQTGVDDHQLLEAFPSAFARHYKVIDRIRSITVPQRTTPIEVYLFYGPPGTGKTQFAYEQGVKAGYMPYELPIGKDFWTSPTMYGRKWIVIDEFKSNLALKDLLKLLDNKPIEAPVKGSFQWWCPDVVVITTNVSPWNWYKYSDRDFERQALFRRLKTGGCYKFEKNDDATPTPVEIDIEDQSVFGPVDQQTFGRTVPKFKSAKETYYEMKMKRLQSTPMMGLIQTPVKKIQQADESGYYF